MRFLFLFSTSTLTGQAAQSYNILKYLVENKHKVWAIIDRNRDGDLKSLLEKAGARLIVDVSISNKNKIIGKYNEINQLRSVLIDMKPDFIISSFSNDHFSAFFARDKVKDKTKLIRIYHNPYVRSDLIHKRLYRDTDIFIFYDNEIYSLFKSKYPELLQRLYLFPTSVDIDTFIVMKRDGLKSNFGLRESAFVLGYVGMFQKGRQHKDLIDTFVRFRKTNQNSQLLMVGGGETLESIKKYAYKVADKSEIAFTGFVSNSNLIETYNAMDIFILLKGGHDSSLRMLYEAQSCGTYILTYKSDPACRLLEITKYGSFIPDIFDQESICESIQMARFHIKDELRESIHRRVDEEFNISRAGELFLRVCEQYK